MTTFSFLLISLCVGQNEPGVAGHKEPLSKSEVSQLMLEVDQDRQSIKNWKRLVDQPDDHVPQLLDLLSRHPDNLAGGRPVPGGGLTPADKNSRPHPPGNADK